MTDQYRLFGFELSPYSVKVRSYLRYKQIPHEWIVRSLDKMSEFQQYAKLPIVPLLIKPDNSAAQDSTPIIEALEEEFPDNSVHPQDPTLAFVSYLIEEFGDEWGNKPMFHYRWRRNADQESAALRLAKEQLGENADAATIESFKNTVKDRMVNRVWFVGSSDETAPFIENNLKELLELLENHLQNRPYLLGKRPCFGDFGLFAQLYECYTDPTPGTLIKEQYPAVANWINRMLDPSASGNFENWASLSDTLLPLIKEQIADCFLHWSSANASALNKGDDSFTVTLRGQPFSQKPQKYHKKSLEALIKRYNALPPNKELEQLLETTGCVEFLS